MSGDVVERLRAIDHFSVEDCFVQSHLYSEAAELITSQAAEIEQLKKEVGRWHSAYEIAHDQAVANGQALAEARAALEPFADAVFNDNGDVTYNLSAFTTDDLFRAYSIFRRARTLTNGGENGR